MVKFIYSLILLPYAFSIPDSALIPDFLIPFLDPWDFPEEGIKVDGGNMLSYFEEKTIEFESQFMPDFNESDPSTRFGLQLPLVGLNEYGCWCYQSGSYDLGAHGSGVPVDSFDEICKSRHMGYDCIVADAPTSQNQFPNGPCDNVGDPGCCDPSHASYQWLITHDIPTDPFSTDPGSFLIECADAIEGDWCKASSCMQDLRFMYEYYQLTEAGESVDIAFSQPHGGFDTSTCPYVAPPGNPGPGTTAAPIDLDEKTCCGEYPYRLWYRTSSQDLDDRECCAFESTLTETYDVRVGHMYHSTTHHCCVDSTGHTGLSTIGNCPGTHVVP